MVQSPHGRRRPTPRSFPLGPASVVLIFLGGVAARAAPDVPALPADPALAALLEEAMAVRPELAQAKATARADRERIPQAAAWPDPMLQLGVQNDGFTSWEIGRMGTSFVSFMASQTIPWPGKRALASEIARLGADQRDPQVTRVRLTVEADVRRAYLDLTLARDRLRLLDRLEAIWRKAEAIARTRYETGSAAQSDVLRAQLELNRTRQRRWALEAAASTALEALNRLRAHPLDEPFEPQTALGELPLVEPSNPTLGLAFATEHSPELASARLATIWGEQTVALLEKDFVPNLNLNAAIMLRGALPPMWQLGVGGTLPVFAGAKQSRAVAEGRLRLEALRRAAESLDELVRLRVRQRQTAMAATKALVDSYRSGLLVLSEATAESTLAQYQVGRVTFASVLEANAGFIADEEGLLQALAQAHRLQISAAEVTLAAPGATDATMATSDVAAPSSLSMRSPPSSTAAGAGSPSEM
jgi:outer membrane protein, heavy metal efflux system